MCIFKFLSPTQPVGSKHVICVHWTWILCSNSHLERVHRPQPFSPVHALTSQCQPFNSVNPGTECQQKTLHETISSGNQSGGPVRCILHSRASELYIGELLMSLIVGKRNCLVFTDIAVTNWEEVFVQIRTNEWVPSTMEHGWMFPTPFFLCLSYIKVISCSSRCVYFEWKGAKCFSPCLHSWH